MSNPLQNIEAEWISDGSEGSSLTKEGNTLTLHSDHKGKPFNVRYNVNVPEYYFEVKLVQLDGHFSIGVVLPLEFRPGYACRGMFYNGNLTNASCALKTSWGPHIRQGDLVGVRTKREGESLEVAFYRNGVCLGIGFRLEAVVDVYQPCLHIDGTGTVIVAIPETLPSLEKTSMEAKGVEGDWKLFEASNEAPIVVPANHDIILTVMKDDDDNTMEFSIHVANRLSARAVILETNHSGHIVQVCGVMSTMMMGPPELMAMEQFFSGSLPNVSVVVERDSELTMGGANVNLLWKRHTKLAETLTSYKH